MPLFITEFEQVSQDSKGQAVPSVRVPPRVMQTPVTIGATSTQSAVFDDNTTLVRVHTDVPCCIAFGANPTATANHIRLGANQTEYFGVPANSKLRVAVITSS